MTPQIAAGDQAAGAVQPGDRDVHRRGGGRKNPCSDATATQEVVRPVSGGGGGTGGCRRAGEPVRPPAEPLDCGLRDREPSQGFGIGRRRHRRWRPVDDGRARAAAAAAWGSEDGPISIRWRRAPPAWPTICSPGDAGGAAADAFIAQHLIDQIDEAGYLTVSLLDLANGWRSAGPGRAGAGDRPDLRSHRRRCARLAECLALTGARGGSLRPSMARLIEHLDCWRAASWRD